MRRSLTLEYWRDQESFVGRLLEVPVPEFGSGRFIKECPITSWWFMEGWSLSNCFD